MREDPRNRISKKALTIWRITGFISLIIPWLIVIGLFVLTVMFQLPFWIVSIVIGIILVLSIIVIGIVPSIRWARWRYEVHEHEIDLQHGVFVVRRTLVPMVRVQHVDTRQGPILRKYKLATVTISTAATVHEIPALNIEGADQLRDYISNLARAADGDV